MLLHIEFSDDVSQWLEQCAFERLKPYRESQKLGMYRAEMRRLVQEIVYQYICRPTKRAADAESVGRLNGGRFDSCMEIP